jgi:hypothetical protein
MIHSPDAALAADVLLPECPSGARVATIGDGIAGSKVKIEITAIEAGETKSATVASQTRF